MIVFIFTDQDYSWSYSQVKYSIVATSPSSIHHTINKSNLTDIGTHIRQYVSSDEIVEKGASAYSLSQKYRNSGYPRDEHNDTPIFMDRDAISKFAKVMRKLAPGASSVEIALEFITANSELFKLENPSEELRLLSETVSQDGKRHIQFDQWYQGVPIWGHRLTVHLEPDGSPYAMNGRYSPTPRDLDVKDIQINKNQAIEKAVDDLSRKTVIQELSNFIKINYLYEGPASQLYVWIDQKSQKPLLVWHVMIRPNVMDQWYYFVDARTGTIVENYNATANQNPVTATAKDALGMILTMNVTEYEGTYYMVDSEASIYTYDAHGKVVDKNHYPSLVISTDNSWTDSIAV
ncbi:MAG TPA: hypothetical protein VMZ04_09410, partial [Anaerolineae bacterium]|nr:hypothetical protein [Anaerolineae bacterium]